MAGQPEIALQTFTIRRYLKNSADISRALARVTALGISQLELARVRFEPETISHIAAVCQQEGLSVASTQMTLSEITRDIKRTVALHQQLGCSRCCVSVVSLSHLREGESGMRRFADELNQLGESLGQQGISLLYHHHNFEFVPLSPGRGDGSRALTGFDVLAEQLDPAQVRLVLDTYWLQRSGHNPAHFIEQQAGRVTGVHLRDMRLARPLWAPRIVDAELGAGSLDFAAITQACQRSGVSYMAIEQDSRTPWQSIGRSLDHLRRLATDAEGVDHKQGNRELPLKKTAAY